jgi:hypothetical protein
MKDGPNCNAAFLGSGRIKPSAQSKRPKVARLAPLSPWVATNLHELGIPDKVIQAIVRHEDVKHAEELQQDGEERADRCDEAVG